MKVIHREEHWVPGTLLIVVGVAIVTLAKINAGSSYKVMAVAEVLAIFLVAWGIASLLYLLEKPVLQIAAPVLFLIGVLINIGGLIGGSSAGIIAGGFLAVIGALLALKR